jgi:hypothetical protein
MAKERAGFFGTVANFFNKGKQATEDAIASVTPPPLADATATVYTVDRSPTKKYQTKKKRKVRNKMARRSRAINRQVAKRN